MSAAVSAPLATVWATASGACSIGVVSSTMFASQVAIGYSRRKRDRPSPASSLRRANWRGLFEAPTWKSPDLAYVNVNWRSLDASQPHNWCPWTSKFFCGKQKSVAQHGLPTMDAFVKKLPSGAGSDVSLYTPLNAEKDGPPLKRVKRDESTTVESEESEQSIFDDDEEQCDTEKVWKRSDGRDKTPKTTDVENALPAMQPDEAALEAYEEYKSSQSSVQEKITAKAKPLWVKGRSSIYVDAFNLALDTVLEEEAKLFDERELGVFDQWKSLDYEAQYLYVT